MPDLSPAETITAAAKLLRATIKAATAGPWTVHETPGHFLRVDQPGPPSKAWTEKTGADLSETNRGTADYIALLDPSVGLPLADWLDSLAGIGFSEHGPMPDELTHALAVARALLGGVS